MAQYLYGAAVSRFLREPDEEIIGKLAASYSNQNLAIQQTYAWRFQLPLLRSVLEGFDSDYLFLEFSIPRMGKRADAVIFMNGRVVVLEFKVGDDRYLSSAIEQVEDYALDLKNFHEGSHKLPILPVLVATNAEGRLITLSRHNDWVFGTICTNAEGLKNALCEIKEKVAPGVLTDALEWASSRYKPTPTIIQAAQALYDNHSVKAISRSEAGAINLSITSDCIKEIISDTENAGSKSKVFLTGVPGAGKTLAGLNIATQNMAIGDDHSVFLSGNGPLVDVLREALAQNLSSTLDEQRRLPIGQARQRTKAFIQNIHHFRDYYLKDLSRPVDKVVVFDEAQRAWTREELSRFMRIKKGVPEFDESEPQFLIGVMNRHESCTIVCLIGGGQEINRGEAGLDEWISTIRIHFPEWLVFHSDQISANKIYLRDKENIEWIDKYGRPRTELHLNVSVRSFRSEKLAEFIEQILDTRVSDARELRKQIESNNYPIVLTRSLETARKWLRTKARGSERTGLVASSGALRLRKYGIWVKHKLKAADWFLKPREDVRSSLFLEEAATEFDIQGLELDWTCMCWDADFYFDGTKWHKRDFSGSRWMQIKDDSAKRYLVNAYRVLLTRARQGMVIFVPPGDVDDKTRRHEYYDGTFEYLKQIGIPVID